MEARKARHRLYPVTVVYTLCSLALLGFCVASTRFSARIRRALHGGKLVGRPEALRPAA